VYGFGGQERSTEINENSYTAEFWQYDSRIGRRWNVDPVKKDYESPYSVLGNNPIWFIDTNGADTTINGNRYKDLAPVIVKAKRNKPYVPEVDFIGSKLTAYNSNEGGYSISNTATVKSLAIEFLANYRCYDGNNNAIQSCGTAHNTVIVGGSLLNEVKNLKSVKKLFLQGANELFKKNFAAGATTSPLVYNMSNLNGPDGDRMKKEVFEDIANGKLLKDSRFFSAEFFLGSYDFSMRVSNDGKDVVLTVYDWKTVKSATDGGRLKAVLPKVDLAPTYQRYFWVIPVKKMKEEYAEAMRYLYMHGND
jgi:hypothetical protein